MTMIPANATHHRVLILGSIGVTAARLARALCVSRHSLPRANLRDPAPMIVEEGYARTHEIRIARTERSAVVTGMDDDRPRRLRATVHRRAIRHRARQRG